MMRVSVSISAREEVLLMLVRCTPVPHLPQVIQSLQSLCMGTKARASTLTQLSAGVSAPQVATRYSKAGTVISGEVQTPCS